MWKSRGTAQSPSRMTMLFTIPPRECPANLWRKFISAVWFFILLAWHRFYDWPAKVFYLSSLITTIDRCTVYIPVPSTMISLKNPLVIFPSLMNMNPRYLKSSIWGRNSLLTWRGQVILFQLRTVDGDLGHWSLSSLREKIWKINIWINCCCLVFHRFILKKKD